MTATLKMRSTAATEELEALLDILEDPAHEGFDVAINRLVDVVDLHRETSLPSSAPLMSRMVEVVGRMPGYDYPEQRIKSLLAACTYFYFTGLPSDIGAIGAKAVGIARRASNDRLLRLSLTFQAVGDSDAGNIPRAIECLAEALDLARSLRDADAEASVLNNLGVALLYSGQFRDALLVLERVSHLVDEHGVTRQFANNATTNVALCCLYTGEIERGLRAAERALRAIQDPRTTSEMVTRALRESLYARLLIETGEVQAAGEHAVAGQRFALASGSLRAHLLAAIAQGLYEVRAGRAEAGIGFLLRAAEQSRRELPSMVRDALSDLVKAYEFLGMHREALAHLQELLEWRKRWHYDNAMEHVRLQLEPLNLEGLETAREDQTFTSPLRSREAQLRGKVAEQEMYRAPIEMLERLAVTAELREDFTGEHCYRLGRLAALLAREAGSDVATCEHIECGARLHDIGKNAIPDAIILKRGRLSEGERKIMNTHAALGADLIASSCIPQMELAEQIARHHHDWWDGSKGEKCSGEAISYAARLAAIADVFDALTHERPHRAAWSVQEALAEITRLAGTQLDPRLCGLFTAMIARLRREHRDLDAFLGEAAKSSAFLQARTRIKDALQDAP